MFLKFYAILVVYPYRRKPCFVAYELFVIQRMVAAKPRVFSVSLIRSITRMYLRTIYG